MAENTSTTALLLKTLLITILFVIHVLLIVFCAIHHRPHIVKLQGVNASLSNIKFTTTATPNDTLHYTLNVTINLRNPNNLYRVHHEKIEALNLMSVHNYQNQVSGAFGTLVNLNSFSQGPKTNALLTPSFQGQHVLNNNFGVENIAIGVVRFYLQKKYKTRFLGWEAKSEFECGLKLSLINFSSIANGGRDQKQLAASFESTEEEHCRVIDHRLSFPIPLRVYFFFMVFLAVGSSNYFLQPYISIGHLVTFIWLLCTVV